MMPVNFCFLLDAETSSIFEDFSTFDIDRFEEELVYFENNLKLKNN